jgi:hypothetical protein
VPHLRLLALLAVAVLAAAAALLVLFGRQSSGGAASGAVEFALGPSGDLHGLLFRAHGGPGASTLLILAGTPTLTPNIDAALASAGPGAPALLLLDTAAAADRARLRTLPREVLAPALARTGSRRVALAGSGAAGTLALELAAAQPLRFCAVAARAPRLADSGLPARERRRALFGGRILLVLATGDRAAAAFAHTLQSQDEQLTLQPDAGSAAWPTQLLRFVAASCR